MLLLIRCINNFRFSNKMPRQRSGSPSPRPQAGRANTRNSSSTRSAASVQRKHSSSNLPAVQPKQETKPATVPEPAPAASTGRTTSDVMKDMAATAAGVAVGSAVGHAVGAGITGAFSGGGRGGSEPAPQQPAAAQPVGEKQCTELDENGPCALEIRQFLKCTEENSDLSVCQCFNDALKKCRQRYNL